MLMEDNNSRGNNVRHNIGLANRSRNALAKICAYKIKIGTLNASSIFHQQIMAMNDSQGKLLTTITQILVQLVKLPVKYDIFINVYTTPLLKSSLCLPL